MAIKARAQKTLTKIFDGSGVFSIIITNENTSIPISNQGLPLNYSSTPTDAYVYSGTSLLTPVTSNPEAGQYTLTASGENISAGLVTINGNHASVANASNMTVGKDTYSITLTASGKDFLGNPFSAQKKQVITPLKRGDDATSYWENVTSSVITKDVKGNMTPDSTTVSAVYQSGMADPDSYSAIFKVYLKSGINFSTTPDYTSSKPEQSYKITPNADTNDIKVEMYDATGTSLLDIQTVPVISQANGVISTKIVYTVTSSQVQPNDSANWSDTIPTVGKGQYLWTKTTFYYTDGSNAVAYSMGSNGKDGSSASLLTLTSDSQAFTFDSDGKTPLPTSQTITLTANLQNVTGTATFVATPYSGTAAGTPITLGGTGNARTITVAQFGSTYDSVVIKATLGALSDIETIHKLSNGGTGKDAITGWLTNEAITLQADSNGNVPSFTSATGSFVVYNGTSQVTGLTVTQSGATGMTLSISGMNYSVTGMSQDNAYVDLSVTTNGVTIKKRLSLSKSKAGATGANGTSVVNSTTPPSNPAEGQWWNDLSVTPNILKVYQKGSWIPYRIDAINLVAGSVKTDNLAADVLLASNVKYTNSNGTTTNLQTFDFDGIKTLLSDNNGNTYSSMDTAVSSTQSWTALSKQVNSLGQINQLFNTEWSPDFAGWGDLSGNTLVSDVNKYVSLSSTYNGSNAIYIDNTAESSTYYTRHRQLVPVSGISSFSLSWAVNTVAMLNYSNLWCTFYDNNYKSVGNFNAGSWAGKVGGGWLVKSKLNISVPSGTYYVLISFEAREGTQQYLSQPMMVFSQTVGDYVQGNYNNNDRVLKIEARADQFDISIKGAQTTADTANTNAGKAQSSADTANNAVNNLSIGARNYYIINNSVSGYVNTDGTVHATSQTNADMMSDFIAVSPNDTWQLTGWGASGIAGNVVYAYYDSNKAFVTGSRVVTSFPATTPSITIPIIIPTGVAYIRVSSQHMDSNQGAKVKVEKGTKPTDWTPAPEDVQAGISQAIDGVSVGGRNYLLNSSGSSLDKWSNNSNLWSITTDTVRGSVFTSKPTVAWTGGGQNALMQTGLNVLIGQQVTISFWAKADKANANFHSEPNGGAVTFNPKLTTSWTKYSYTIPNLATAIIYFMSVDVGTNYYLDNLKVELGNKATDWTPAPEDQSAEITTKLKLATDSYTLGIDANGNLISGISGNSQTLSLNGATIYLNSKTVIADDFTTRLLSAYDATIGNTLTIGSGGSIQSTLSGKIWDFTPNAYYYMVDNTNPWFQVDQTGTFIMNSLGDLEFNGTITAPDKGKLPDGSTPYAYPTQTTDGSTTVTWTNKLTTTTSLGIQGLRVDQQNYNNAASSGGFLYATGHGLFLGMDQVNPRAVLTPDGQLSIDKVEFHSGYSWKTVSIPTAVASIYQVGGSVPNLTVDAPQDINMNSDHGWLYFRPANTLALMLKTSGYVVLSAKKTGSGGSALYMASDGAIIAHSSATKYKSNIEYDTTTSLADRLMTVDLASWNDKNEENMRQQYKLTGKTPDYAIDKDGARYVGLIAEDLVKADLEEFVVRDVDTGSVESIRYDRIGIALIPAVRKQREMINELRLEIERLKDKVK